MKMVLKVEVAHFIGRTKVHMKEIGSKTNSTVLEHINGKTGECTREDGKTIRCMEKGFTLGLMAQSFRAITIMILNTGAVSLSGLMERSL